MRNQPINRIMTTPAVVVHPDTSLQEAGELMSRRHLHHLPVVDGERLVGIVSAADLACRPEGHGATAGGRIADVMRRDPTVLGSNSTLHDAATLLAGSGFHSLPVTDPAGQLVGIVTSTDLIDVLVRQLPSSSEAGPGEQKRHPGIAAEFSDRAALTAAITEAEQRWTSAGKTDPVAGALLYLAGMSRELEIVRRAADIYLRSGQGEHEHAGLVRALENARERLGPGLSMGRL